MATAFTLAFAGAAAGISPYAAVQLQWFRTPTYSETDLTGGGFGLTYNGMTANDTRGELGARFDDLTAFYGNPLILRARLAWAHDWVDNPALNAAFQALPGSGVHGFRRTDPAQLGAEQCDRRTALRAELVVYRQVRRRVRVYAGTGTLRYTW